MTEGVTIALITNFTVIIVAIVTRIWSRSEHKQNIDKVETVIKQGNSREGEQLRIALTAAKALEAVKPTEENSTLAKIAQEKVDLHHQQNNK